MVAGFARASISPRTAFISSARSLSLLVHYSNLDASIARMLWGFNLGKARDADGKEIDVDTFAYTDGKRILWSRQRR